jgi:hypothetical protein
MGTARPSSGKKKRHWTVVQSFLLAVQQWRRQIMAKGQLRSNKEVRKPKKDKAAAAKVPSSPFGSQVKDAGKPAPKGK